MVLDLNIFQEVFLVAYSILYGVVLQSLSGLQPFPLGRTVGGYKERSGVTKTDFRLCVGKSPMQLKLMWRRRSFCMHAYYEEKSKDPTLTFVEFTDRIKYQI